MKKILTIFIIIISTQSLFSQNYNDTLADIIQKSNLLKSDTTKLEYLKEQIIIHQGTSIGIALCKELKQAAQKQKKLIYEYYACEISSFLYLQAYDNINLTKENNELKKCADKLKIYSSYFKGLSYEIILYIYQGRYNKALIVSKILEEESKKVENIQGQILAAISFYSLYVSTNEYDKAWTYISEAMTLTKKEPCSFDIYTRVYSNIINFLNGTKKYEEAFKCEKEYQAILKKRFENNPNYKNQLTPILCKSELNFHKYYLGQSDYNKAKEHLDNANKYNEQKYNQHSKILITLAEIDYYYQLKEYKKVIEIVDKNEILFKEKMPSKYIDIIVSKAKALQGLGTLKESVLEYDKAYMILDTLSFEASLNDALSSLGQDANSELKIKNKKLEKNFKLIITIFIGIFLLISIFYLIYFTITNNKEKRIKRDLEKVYKKGQRKNNESYLLKKEISHAVRTPLNSIVGFSELIADNQSIDKTSKEDFKNIINESSNRLQEYIEDILVLSKIESRKIEVNIEKIYIKTIVEKICKNIDSQVSFKNIDNNTYINSDSKIIFKILETCLDQDSSIEITKKSDRIFINIYNSPLIREEYIKHYTNIKWIINSNLITLLGWNVIEDKGTVYITINK